MRRELLIAAAPGEWRAALVEDGVATELFVLRRVRHELGSLHLGRVRQLLPGLAAALVDIGDERPGFLPSADAGGADMHEGARVVVQIRREAQGGKAARLTMRPQPPGRATDWQAIVASAEGREPPARLAPPATRAAALAAAVAATPPNRIATENRAVVPELRAAFPSVEVTYRAEAEWQIDLDAEIDLALGRDVALPGGGVLHFEPTRAGVMIDVDTGGANAASPEDGALRTNLAAAAAIARQVRLRNLGGGIVIDFVGLDRRELRERVRRTLAAALAADPLRPEVLGWTRLGHLELVRPRRARPLAEIMLLPDGRDKSAATVACEALRELARAARHRPARLVAAPAVAAALAGEAAHGMAELEALLGRQIEVAADPQCERFQIVSA